MTILPVIILLFIGLHKLWRCRDESEAKADQDPRPSSKTIEIPKGDDDYYYWGLQFTFVKKIVTCGMRMYLESKFEWVLIVWTLVLHRVKLRIGVILIWCFFFINKFNKFFRIWVFQIKNKTAIVFSLTWVLIFQSLEVIFPPPHLHLLHLL